MTILISATMHWSSIMTNCVSLCTHKNEDMSLDELLFRSKADMKSAPRLSFSIMTGLAPGEAVSQYTQNKPSINHLKPYETAEKASRLHSSLIFSVKLARVRFKTALQIAIIRPAMPCHAMPSPLTLTISIRCFFYTHQSCITGSSHGHTTITIQQLSFMYLTATGGR